MLYRRFTEFLQFFNILTENRSLFVNAVDTMKFNIPLFQYRRVKRIQSIKQFNTGIEIEGKSFIVYFNSSSILIWIDPCLK